MGIPTVRNLRIRTVKTFENSSSQRFAEFPVYFPGAANGLMAPKSSLLAEMIAENENGIPQSEMEIPPVLWVFRTPSLGQSTEKRPGVWTGGQF